MRSGSRATLAAAFLAGFAAGQTYDVASVKPNKSEDRSHSSFPLGPGDVYVQNGGLFSATNYPPVSYIFFAYKIAGSQEQVLLPQLPDWAKTERFDIQARAEGTPGRDDMRMMMRALLADRFKLAIHNETHDLPAIAFVLAKAGKTGQRLRPHGNGAPCTTVASPAAAQAPLQTVDGDLPAPATAFS